MGVKSESALTPMSLVPGTAILEAVFHVAMRSLAGAVVVVIAMLLERGQIDVAICQKGVTFFCAPPEGGGHWLAIDRAMHRITETAFVATSVFLA